MGRARDETNRARTCGVFAGGSERGFVAVCFGRGESRGRGSGGFDLRGCREAFGASAGFGGRMRAGARRNETRRKNSSGGREPEACLREGRGMVTGTEADRARSASHGGD